MRVCVCVYVSRYVSLFVGVYVRGGERDCVCVGAQERERWCMWAIT